MEIPINAKIQCQDGPFGRSTHVILMPASEKITHLVVENGGFPATEYMVPVEMVKESSPELIELKCNCEEVTKLPIFDKVEFIPFDISGVTGGAYMMWPYYVPVNAYTRKEKDHIPANELVIRRGAVVEASDGRVGKVDEFLIDPGQDNITHLVLRDGHLWGTKDVSIPVGQIDHYQDNVVYLKLDKKTIEALPEITIRHK
jgi:sporulation protein YlmC with PRC-barrel domain